jgi:hypothetical protein
MIEQLIQFLVIALVMLVIYLVLQRFLPGDIMWIAGLILGLILLVLALKMFRILAVVGASLLLCGCASVANTAKHGGPNLMRVNIEDNMEILQTASPQLAPAKKLPSGLYEATVKRSDGLFNPNLYYIRYNDRPGIVEARPKEVVWRYGRVNPMVLFNVLYPFGFVVDFATGAAWIPDGPQILPKQPQTEPQTEKKGQENGTSTTNN